MVGTAKRRIAEHIEVTWLAGETAPATCPNCGAGIDAQRLLDIDYRPPDAVHRFILQRCPVCDVRFVDNPEMMDYSTDLLIEIGWNTYQVQLGAGVWPISAPLARVEKRAGARALEIGGAFGFGLDFCARARGWQGVGYDPSPLAAFGARELGLTLNQAYFTDADTKDGPWDVVIATEVIEHLPEIPPFLRLLRAALADDGVLVLTTPDAACINDELQDGLLLPLLSPGAHHVLQTETSLRVALNNAGFGHVVITRSGLTLVAYASASEFALSDDAAQARATYRHYLVERAKGTGLYSDLRLGFAGRGLFEAVNDGDWVAADTAWEALIPAVKARFGLDLETMTSLPKGTFGSDLAKLGQVMPLGLGMILFARAMRRLAAKAPRAEIEARLKQADEAIDALQEALGQRSLTDGLSGSIKDILQIELLLCGAEAGDPAAVEGLIALGDVVAGWRGFTAVVNKGAFALGQRLLDGLLGGMPGTQLPRDLRRDALISLANLYLAPGAETLSVFAVSDALSETGEDAGPIRLGGFTRLVNASRYDDALEIGRRYGVEALAEAQLTGKAGRDGKVALMVLDLAVGDPAEIPGRLVGLDLEPERRDVLLVEAFIRLVNASRYQDALGFIADYDVLALAGKAGGGTERNARISRMVLDLAVGDPAEIPGRLAGLDLEPARRGVLLVEAFIRLVNSSRYQDALGFIADYDVPALAVAAGGETERNARLARMVLDLAEGDPAEIPGRLQGLDLEPAKRGVLLVEAFIRLVNASRYDEALGFIAAYDVPGLATKAGGETERNARISRMVLDLAVGDPAEIPGRLEGLDLEPERRDVLLVEAFIRLVNASRYDEALGFIADYDVLALAARAGGDTARNARLSRMVLDLAVGDPAEIPGRLVGLDLEPARRDVLLVEAFIRLVNASRYDEALGFIASYDVLALAVAAGGETARDARISRVMLDLAVGDPAEIPGRLVGLDIGPAQRGVLLVEAFIRLVNASRYEEALAFIADYDVPTLAEHAGGETARNASLARMVLDLAVGDPAEIPGRLEGVEIEPAKRGVLLVEAFVRLVNGSRFDEAWAFVGAHDVPGLIGRVGGKTAADGAIALAVAELALGDPASVPAKLALAEVPGARADALVQSAFCGLINAGRYDEADAFADDQPALSRVEGAKGEAARDARIALYLLDLNQNRLDGAAVRLSALETTGADEALLHRFYADLFIRAVNRGEFGLAAQLAHKQGIERRLPACDETLREDARAALVILDMQPAGDASRLPARLHDLRASGAEERALGLAQSAFATLVNGGEFQTARDILPLFEAALIKLKPPYAPHERDAAFAAGVLFLQDKGDLPRSAASFARLREDLTRAVAPGGVAHPLFWPALRGEVMALHRLKRAEEATALLLAFTTTYTDAPDDLRAQLPKQAL
jgi:SAM-dependent methyltransferase